MSQARLPLQEVTGNAPRKSISWGTLPQGRPLQPVENGPQRDQSGEEEISRSNRSNTQHSAGNNEHNSERGRARGLQIVTSRGIEALTPPQSRSPTPSPTLHKVPYRNEIFYCKIKNAIEVRNPRDGIQSLRLEPGRLVQVYYESKCHKYCWISLEEWNFGWCVERSDLEDRPDLARWVDGSTYFGVRV